jgi:pimeloyl-ACP methyl ester carboxylesterase
MAPAAPAADTPLEGYADQLAELLDHLQIAQATVIGFSMGGLVARAFALHYPQRLAAWWCSTACSTAPPSRAPG